MFVPCLELPSARPLADREAWGGRRDACARQGECRRTYTSGLCQALV